MHPTVKVSVPEYVKKDVGFGLLFFTTLADGLAFIGVLFALPICVFVVRRLLGRESSNRYAKAREWRGPNKQMERPDGGLCEGLPPRTISPVSSLTF